MGGQKVVTTKTQTFFLIVFISFSSAQKVYEGLFEISNPELSWCFMSIKPSNEHKQKYYNIQSVIRKHESSRYVNDFKSTRQKRSPVEYKSATLFRPSYYHPSELFNQMNNQNVNTHQPVTYYVTNPSSNNQQQSNPHLQYELIRNPNVQKYQPLKYYETHSLSNQQQTNLPLRYKHLENGNNFQSNQFSHRSLPSSLIGESYHQPVHQSPVHHPQNDIQPNITNAYSQYTVSANHPEISVYVASDDQARHITGNNYYNLPRGSHIENIQLQPLPNAVSSVRQILTRPPQAQVQDPSDYNKSNFPDIQQDYLNQDKPVQINYKPHLAQNYEQRPAYPIFISRPILNTKPTEKSNLSKRNPFQTKTNPGKSDEELAQIYAEMESQKESGESDEQKMNDYYTMLQKVLKLTESGISISSGKFNTHHDNRNKKKKSSHGQQNKKNDRTISVELVSENGETEPMSAHVKALYRKVLKKLKGYLSKLKLSDPFIRFKLTSEIREQLRNDNTTDTRIMLAKLMHLKMQLEQMERRLLLHPKQRQSVVQSLTPTFKHATTTTDRPKKLFTLPINRYYNYKLANQVSSLNVYPTMIPAVNIPSLVISTTTERETMLNVTPNTEIIKPTTWRPSSDEMLYDTESTHNIDISTTTTKTFENYVNALLGSEEKSTDMLSPSQYAPFNHPNNQIKPNNNHLYEPRQGTFPTPGFKKISTFGATPVFINAGQPITLNLQIRNPTIPPQRKPEHFFESNIKWGSSGEKTAINPIPQYLIPEKVGPVYRREQNPRRRIIPRQNLYNTERLRPRSEPRAPYGYNTNSVLNLPTRNSYPNQNSQDSFAHQPIPERTYESRKAHVHTEPEEIFEEEPLEDLEDDYNDYENVNTYDYDDSEKLLQSFHRVQYRPNYPKRKIHPLRRVTSGSTNVGRMYDRPQTRRQFKVKKAYTNKVFLNRVKDLLRERQQERRREFDENRKTFHIEYPAPPRRKKRPLRTSGFKVSGSGRGSGWSDSDFLNQGESLEDYEYSSLEVSNLRDTYDPLTRLLSKFNREDMGHSDRRKVPQSDLPESDEEITYIVQRPSIKSNVRTKSDSLSSDGYTRIQSKSYTPKLFTQKRFSI